MAADILPRQRLAVKKRAEGCGCGLREGGERGWGGVEQPEKHHASGDERQGEPGAEDRACAPVRNTATAAGSPCMAHPHALERGQVYRVPRPLHASELLLPLKQSNVVHRLTLGVRALRRDGHCLPVLRDDPSEGLNHLGALLVGAYCRPCVDSLE